MGKGKPPKKQDSTTNSGLEQQLWAAADKMRGHMDPSEYKHVVLGLIFLKFISDAFEEKHEALCKEASSDPEDHDEYAAVSIFWVPKEARWKYLRSQARTPQIGKVVDDAMMAIEAENRSLKGVLPKDYARPALDKSRLGELIDLISKIGMGDDRRLSKDVLGRVYEYFLGRFASAEGKGGGEFYTPQSIVRLLVEMIQAAEVIDELVDIAKEMKSAKKRGEELGLNEDEEAFYDALSENDIARKELGDEKLKLIAQELVIAVKNSTTIDWVVKESVRAKIRVTVKHILRRHGYPADLEDKITQTVLEQAEILSESCVS